MGRWEFFDFDPHARRARALLARQVQRNGSCHPIPPNRRLHRIAIETVRTWRQIRNFLFRWPAAGAHLGAPGAPPVPLDLSRQQGNWQVGSRLKHVVRLPLWRAWLGMVAVVGFFLVFGCAAKETRTERKQLARDAAAIERDIQQEISAEKTATAPETGAEISPASGEARLREIDQVMAQYEAYLRNQSGSPKERALAMRRLADLAVEREKERYLIEMARYEEEIAQGKRRPPPLQDFRQAVRMYERLRKDFPQYAEEDHLYYQLASSYDQSGELEKSIFYLRELVKRFPQSAYLQEVYFRLGEYEFDLNRFDVARQLYQNGLRHRQNSLYTVNSLYKLGWTFFLMEDFVAATDTFRTLLDQEMQGVSLSDWESSKRPDRPKEKRLGASLEREGLFADALWMMARSLGELKNTNYIEGYFRKIGDRPYRGDVYRALGDDLMRQERLQEALQAYEIFFKIFPTHPKVLDAYQRILEALDRQAKTDLAARYRTRAIEQFAPAKAWWKANTQAARTESEAFRQKTLLELAKFYHHMAQKSVPNQQDAYEKGIRAYEQFLHEYSKAPERGEVSFLLAECFFAMKRFRQARPHYEQALAGDLTPEMRTQAAVGLFESAYAQGKAENWQGDTLEELQRARLVGEAYLTDEKVIVDFLLRQSHASYEAKRYPLARLSLEALIERIPNKRETFLALRLLALCHFQEKAYETAAQVLARAIQLAQTLNRQTVGLITEKEVKETRELRASSFYQLAEDQEKQRGVTQASEAYLRVLKEEPNSQVSAISHYRAGTGLLADREPAHALKGLEVLHQMARQYPQHPSSYAALLETARWLKEQKRYAASAQDYEWAGQIAKKPDDQKHAFHQAGLAWDLAGSSKEAARVWHSLLERDSVTRAEKVEFQYYLAMDYLALRQTPKALPLLQGIARSREGEENYFAARALLALAEQDEKAYRRVSLEKSAKQKQALFAKALQSYALAAQRKDAEVSTRASYQIGFLLLDFAKALRESPPPKGLSRQERQEYTALLEEQAFPLEEKAIAAFEENIRSARKSKVFNEWVERSYSELSRLVPARYDRREILPPLGATQKDSSSQEAQRHYEDGIRMLKEGQKDSARDAFSRSIAVKPNFYRGYFGLGLSQRKIGAFKEAERSYLAAIQYAGVGIQMDPSPLRNLGILYELYMEEPNAALKYYREYVKLTASKSEQEIVESWIQNLEP